MIAAARRAEIDAIVSSGPDDTAVMETEELVEIVADTRAPPRAPRRSMADLIIGVIYAAPSYIEEEPQAVQKVVDAFVRGLDVANEPFGRVLSPS